MLDKDHVQEKKHLLKDYVWHLWNTRKKYWGGEMNKLSHGCTLDCFDCCKFNVYVEEGKIIKIEGDKEHPYTKGFICKKGLAHLNRLNHHKRISKPLLKVKGKWKEITFDEAIKIMVHKLKGYKDKYSPKSVLYYEQYGNGSLLKSIGDIFFNFYGGASKAKGGPCWSAGIHAQKQVFGDVVSHSLDDLIHSKNIFVWGKNPANTTIHTMQSIKKAKANGSKVTVIDPIFTSTAKIADKYVRVKPGGDEALALAMGKIIIERNYLDKDYIQKYINGFEEYKDYLLSLDMNKLSFICGIEVSEIEELAKLYSEKHSSILLGYGMQKYYNGGNTIKLISFLGAITGQIGISGGGVNYANRVYPDILNTDPYNSAAYGESREFYVSQISEFINDAVKGKAHARNNIYCPEQEGAKEDNVPLKMAVITKSNLLNQLPNLNKLKDAFRKIEFKVCIDMFMTDTAEECDLFIPASSTLESEDLLFSSMTNPYIIFNEKLIEPAEELMDEYYFFREIAKRLELKGYPMVEKKEYLNEVIKPLKSIHKEIDLEYIKNNYFTPHKNVAWEDKKFLTKSGKIEFNFNKMNYNKEESKFRLLTNHSKDTLFSQHVMDEKGPAKAYINSKEAKKLNIYEEENVSLISDNGKITVQIIIDDCIGDNIVMMYVGWWRKHGNPNYITVSGISDIGGQVTYNETLVDIVKEKGE